MRKSRKGREEWKIYNNVFDQFTERILFDLSSKGYFDELKSSYALGKEANIFIASKGKEKVIVKIYRLENCNFNKMYSYIAGDPRFQGLENQKRKIIFNWVQREYRNLLIAREKIKVPTPFVFQKNVLVMEMIGDESPSLTLKDLHPQNPQEFYDKTLDNILLLLESGLVHGDLSEFNILNHEENPVFIDISQGTPINSFSAKELLERDLYNIHRFFKKIGVNKDRSKEVLKKFDELNV